jgi:hypothetical protein
MSTRKEDKLKYMLEAHKPGVPFLSGWLEEHGISRDLQKRYRKSAWLSSLGTGVYQRPHDTVTWRGALCALQQQAAFPVHAGALTALSLQGQDRYMRLGGEAVYLFSSSGRKLPKWFCDHDWGVPVQPVRTSFLPEDTGLTAHQEQNFTIRVSSAERAMLECLYLAPERMDLVECYQLMEGMANLRPKLLQDLLESCQSVKVKRLFLYMADKAGHQWRTFLDTDRFDLGAGDRAIVKGGAYVSKFGISVPEELVKL